MMWAVKLRLSTFVAVGLLVPCLLLAQSPNSAVRSTCADGRVIDAFNPDGWTVPGISKTELKTRAKWGGSTSPPLPKSAEVYLDVLESKAPEGSFAVVSCIDDKSGLVTIREQEVDVTDDIWQFEMNGSVFAYKVIGGWASKDVNNRRVRLGAAETLLFFDPDGCGRFKVMRYADGDWPFTLIVPDWVRLPQRTCAPRTFH
jgi:hypothetical protein